MTELEDVNSSTIGIILFDSPKKKYQERYSKGTEINVCLFENTEMPITKITIEREYISDIV